MTDREITALALAILREMEWRAFVAELAEARRERLRRKKDGLPVETAA